MRAVSKHRSEVLTELILQNKYSCMIEIGIGTAANAEAILQKMPADFKYYGIDPFQVYSEYTNDINSRPERVQRNRQTVERLLSDPRVTIFKEFSANVDRIFPKICAPVNLVFIDGNHEYSYVYQDSLLYWTIMNYGDSVMVWHDYNDNNFPGVTKAVDAFCIEHDLLLHHIGDLVFVYK